MSEDLLNIQKRLQHCIQTGENSESLVHCLLEKPPLALQDRLKIYQEAYRVRMLESLDDDFQKTREFLGAEAFSEILMNLIKQRPSKVRNLAEYSECLVDFLRESHPEAYCIALTEWQMLLSAQIKPISPTLSPLEVSQGVPFRLRLSSATFINKAQVPPVVVYRCGDEVSCKSMSLADVEILEFLSVERSLEDLEQFSEQRELLVDNLIKNIFDWISMQIVVCVHVHPEIKEGPSK